MATAPHKIEFDPSSHSHRRFNPLTQTWVLCSPHRTKRPWQGAVEPPSAATRPAYDAACYLCPGNVRANGEKTEVYDSCYVFENDFAALVADDVAPPPPPPAGLEGLFRSETARGKCHVICFSPRHDLTVAEMSVGEIVNVVEAWTKLYKQVSEENQWLKYVQIFENKGSMMGCSNPHPHGQSWSLSYIPTIPQTILTSQKAFAQTPKPLPSTPLLSNGLPCLLLSYVTEELRLHESTSEESRVVLVGKEFVALVPFWAGWPFECLVLPYKRHIPSLAHLTQSEKIDLADVIGGLSRAMDNLFECSFGYSMGVYQSPVYRPHPTPTEVDEGNLSEFAQLHIGFYPPLLRSSTVKKFLVGFELFAETQRDITPEQAAKRLREKRGVHYKQRGTSLN